MRIRAGSVYNTCRNKKLLSLLANGRRECHSQQRDWDDSTALSSVRATTSYNPPPCLSWRQGGPNTSYRYQYPTEPTPKRKHGSARTDAARVWPSVVLPMTILSILCSLFEKHIYFSDRQTALCVNEHLSPCQTAPNPRMYTSGRYCEHVHPTTYSAPSILKFHVSHLSLLPKSKRCVGSSIRLPRS
jgi:hypothetical protein